MSFIQLDLDIALTHVYSVIELNNHLCIEVRKYIDENKDNLICHCYENEKINKSINPSFGLLMKNYEYLPKYLIDKYSNIENVYIIFDDIVANENDYDASDKGVQTLNKQESIYRYAKIKKLNTEIMREIVWCFSVSWHFLCLIIRIKDKEGPIVINDFLDHVADPEKFEVIECIIGAFDGEGYIHLQLGLQLQ